MTQKTRVYTKKTEGDRMTEQPTCIHGGLKGRNS